MSNLQISDMQNEVREQHSTLPSLQGGPRYNFGNTRQEDMKFDEQQFYLYSYKNIRPTQLIR